MQDDTGAPVERRDHARHQLGQAMLKKFAAAAVHLLFFAGCRRIGPTGRSASSRRHRRPRRHHCLHRRCAIRTQWPRHACSERSRWRRPQPPISRPSGAFSAGKDSSAVLSVDGRPARVFLVGQEVGSGLEAGRGGTRSRRARVRWCTSGASACRRGPWPPSADLRLRPTSPYKAIRSRRRRRARRTARASDRTGRTVAPAATTPAVAAANCPNLSLRSRRCRHRPPELRRYRPSSQSLQP